MYKVVYCKATITTNCSKFGCVLNCITCKKLLGSQPNNLMYCFLSSSFNLSNAFIE